MEPLEFYQRLREVCTVQERKISIKESNLPKLEILQKLRQGVIVYKNLNSLEQGMVSYAKFIENDENFTTLDMY